MRVRYVRENSVLEQLGEDGGALGAPGGTKPATTTGKSDVILGFADGAPNDGETVVRSILRLLNIGVGLLLKQLVLSAASR